jgi:hypothetical protein
MAEISADISAKKGSFWIEPLTAYSRVLTLLRYLRNSESRGIFAIHKAQRKSPWRVASEIKEIYLHWRDPISLIPVLGLYF